MVHIIELVGQPKVEFAQQVTVSIQIESPNEFLHRRTRGSAGAGRSMGPKMIINLVVRSHVMTT